MWYEGWDIQMFFLFYQIIKDKKENKIKSGETSRVVAGKQAQREFGK